MFRRGTSIVVVALVAIGALLGAPSAGAARSKTHVVPAEYFVFANAPGTKGWHLQVAAEIVPKAARLTVALSGPHHQSVTYLVHGRTAAGGGLEAKLPGLGRVALRFEQTSERKIDFEGPRGCTSSGTAVDRIGYFRGVIEFHGEGGYTEVDRHSAHGRIAEFPRQACPVRHRHAKHGSEGFPPEATFLLAGRPDAGGQVTFNAFRFGGPAPFDQPLFYAAYTRSPDGMIISARTTILGEPQDLTVPASSEATIVPPAPFSGTATFKLESPTSASWTGDLSVEVPTLGTVSLAGPSFWSQLCARGSCTKTLPSGAGTRVPAVEIQVIDSAP